MGVSWVFSLLTRALYSVPEASSYLNNHFVTCFMMAYIYDLSSHLDLVWQVVGRGYQFKIDVADACIARFGMEAIQRKLTKLATERNGIALYISRDRVVSIQRWASNLAYIITIFILSGLVWLVIRSLLRFCLFTEGRPQRQERHR